MNANEDQLRRGLKPLLLLALFIVPAVAADDADSNEAGSTAVEIVERIDHIDRQIAELETEREKLKTELEMAIAEAGIAYARELDLEPIPLKNIEGENGGTRARRFQRTQAVNAKLLAIQAEIEKEQPDGHAIFRDLNELRTNPQWIEIWKASGKSTDWPEIFVQYAEIYKRHLR